MEIQELEFIRDFCDYLANLRNDLNQIAIELDEQEDALDNPYIKHCLSSLAHQAELTEKLFNHFKDKLDIKYFNIWVAKYPQMLKIS